MEDSQLKILKTFFNGVWVPNHYEPALVEEVNALRPGSVLDVGCGYNPYKGKIHNLHGIDIVNPQADEVVDVLDFRPARKFDVVMALGSLNFGGEEDILARLRHIRALLENHGKLFMRVNPGIPWPKQPELKIFPWNHEKILRFGQATGFRLDGKVEEVPTERGVRLKFVYLPV